MRKVADALEAAQLRGWRYQLTFYCVTVLLWVVLIVTAGFVAHPVFMLFEFGWNLWQR